MVPSDAQEKSLGRIVRPSLAAGYCLMQSFSMAATKRLMMLAACVFGAFSDLRGTGSAPPDFDLQSFITEESRRGVKTIVIPPGQYRVTPKKRQHLLLSGLKDTVIDATGVELICTETTRALTIWGCMNLTIIGLTIDYDPLPYTQGRITRISADKRIHEIELFDGYPEAGTAIPQKYEIYNPETGTLRNQDYPVDSVEAPDSRRLVVSRKRVSPQDDAREGDIIVINSRHAPNGSIPHAVLLEKSSFVTLENVTLHASNSFGFLELDCDKNTYLRCRVARRSPDEDLVRREAPRIRSLNADAFHSKHAKRGPSYIECEAHFMGDDAINICGNYHVIMQAEGNLLRVLARDSFIEAQETVELLSYSGIRLPDAKVLEVTQEGVITPEERTFLLSQRMDERIRTHWTSKAYRVRLDRVVDLPKGSLIASRERMGSGFRVSGCKFGMNRSRGILVKGSQGEIRDNLIVGTRSEAIKLEAEYWWLESGTSDDVRIIGNEIRGCLGVAIGVYSFGGDGAVSPSGTHRNIDIRDNRISDSAQPSIVATSTEGLKIRDNSLTKPSLLKALGLRGNFSKLLKGRAVSPILVIASDSAEVDAEHLSIPSEELRGGR